MAPSGDFANRLAQESSPYLRLHAHNPVDWYPWGPEALARARAEDKPIFLSVGYSTCYWCHVMERESFSNPAVAAAMNRAFVNVKVDREERPDLDEIYMLATQLLTGQGGWPNSVFLTPKLEPFFAGTYFPPEDRFGRPGFSTVVASLEHAWGERRRDVETQAAELGEAIRRHLDELEAAPGPPAPEVVERALESLRQRFDATWGGFGESPKFPSPANLFLLQELAGTRSEAAMMLTSTLDGMARGGLFDQLAGGFHRYATDREWRLPHFEKMLYDNGLLLELYAREHSRNPRPELARVALETAEFLAREMTSPEGALWSAIDAETDGHEGAYYVWTRAEIDAALGAEDATFAAPLLGFAGEPFFEDNAYVLHLPVPLDVAARARRTSREALLAELAPLRARLLVARERRRRPATDDKVLTDWNGMAIAGLAVAGRALSRPELTARAARAAEFVLAKLVSPAGTLQHAWREGRARIDAYLSDYVFLVHGLLALHAATGEGRWLGEAARLADEQARRLGSPRGGFFNVAQADDLLIRGKEIFDGALPAANAVAALDLQALAAATGEARFAAAAESTLRAFAPVVEFHPEGCRMMVLATLRALGAVPGPPPRETRAGEPTSAPVSPPARPAVGAIETLESEARSVVSFRLDIDPGPRTAERGFLVHATVRAGWHLAAPGEAEGLEVGLDGGEIVALEPVEIPRAASGEAILEGHFHLAGRLLQDAPRAALVVRYQACDDSRCLPPVEVELPIA
ncbi:MAG: thioredoxin domain-containing protein [Thermoanaerobaculia bacterium]